MATKRSKKGGTAVSRKRSVKKVETSTIDASSQKNTLPAITEKKNGKSLSASSRYEIARMEEPWSFAKSDLKDKKIIYPEMEDREVADAYRRIRTKIVQKGGSDKRVIQVTGIDQKSGASFTTINLAAAFAFDESKTALLLDCDFDSPGFKLGQFNNRTGLIDYLEDEDNEEVELEEIIHPVGIKRMRLVPSGGRREMVVEHFSSMKMRELIESVKTKYNERYIFVNSPPISRSADAEILTELCDFTVLVVPYGKVTEKKLEEVAETIGKEKLLGVILNNVPKVPKSIFNLKNLCFPGLGRAN